MSNIYIVLMLSCIFKIKFSFASYLNNVFITLVSMILLSLLLLLSSSSSSGNLKDVYWQDFIIHFCVKKSLPVLILIRIIAITITLNIKRKLYWFYMFFI